MLELALWLGIGFRIGFGLVFGQGWVGVSFSVVIMVTVQFAFEVGVIIWVKVIMQF